MCATKNTDSPQEEMEGDAHRTTKKEHYYMDLECPTSNQCGKLKQLTYGALDKYKLDIIRQKHTITRKAHKLWD